MNTKKSKEVSDTSGERILHLRVPKDTWTSLKKSSLINECTMAEAVIKLVERSKVKINKDFDSIE